MLLIMSTKEDDLIARAELLQQAIVTLQLLNLNLYFHHILGGIKAMVGIIFCRTAIAQG